MQIPQEQREQVEEVTMDFSDSMFAVVTEAFPNAAIVIDVKRCIEAVEELRLKAKREAQNKEKAMFKKKLEQLVKSRKYYRKKHPKKYKGKPQRLNKRFRPTMLANGETVIELLTQVSAEWWEMDWQAENTCKDTFRDVPKDKGSIYFDL